jgi:hypothetical protein
MDPVYRYTYTADREKRKNQAVRDKEIENDTLDIKIK